MKILSLINIVENIEQLSQDKYNIKKLEDLETTYLSKTYDIYNDSIIELMIQLKNEIKEEDNTTLEVISVNNSSIDYFLKNIYSFNIDKVIRIETPNQNQINNNIISDNLCEYIEEKGCYDIILIGEKSMLFGSSLTPYKVANKLDIQLINNIINIQPLEDIPYAKITCIKDNKIFVKKVKYPFVGIISDIPNMFLRVPTLKNKLRGKKKSIEVFTPSSTQVKIEDTNYYIMRENKTRKGIEYKHVSKNITQNYLSTEIAKAKKINLGNIHNNRDINDIYYIIMNNTRIYFCNKESKYYNFFIKWNIKNQHKIYLDISDININKENIIYNKKIYAENLTTRETHLFKKDEKIISFCSNKNTINKILDKIKARKIKDNSIIDQFNYVKNEIIEYKEINNMKNIENEKVLIAIGKGVKTKKTVNIIKDFANKNEIQVVGTRMAAMNAFLPLKNMVGVSSKQIDPNLLICIGLSGAPAFFEGVKDSKKIISINNDDNAPIFKNSDIIINEDLNNIFNNNTE